MTADTKAKLAEGRKRAAWQRMLRTRYGLAVEVISGETERGQALRLAALAQALALYEQAQAQAADLRAQATELERIAQRALSKYTRLHARGSGASFVEASDEEQRGVVDRGRVLVAQPRRRLGA